MWRELGWAACRVLVTWVPVAALLGYASEVGVFPTRLALAFLVFGMAVVILAELIAHRVARSMWRNVTLGFGPESTSVDNGRRTHWWHRLNLWTAAIRPAVLRLDRAWREHAAAAEARLAAAEAIIAAAPDPLILIDRQRRIVRVNAASAAFIGPGTGPRDLAGAQRRVHPIGAGRAGTARSLGEARRPGARRCGGDPDPARRYRVEAQRAD